jgi:diguanylate cyclase (GGDEF)-like protein/PAS domain S-box-containing protein
LYVRDVTERRKIDADQRLAAKVFENSTEAIYITNQQGDIVQVNKAFADITGYKRDDVIGKKPSQLGSGWHEINFAMDIKPVLDTEGQWAGELMSRRASGEAFLVWMSISNVLDSHGELLGLITSFRDITEAKSSEESIRKLAYYDPLTDLPNRMLFHDRLLQALQRANRNRHYIAILFMDLDGFKGVNDVLGHAVGDRLLTEAAKRLKDCIRSDDTVARVGGDEFTVILNALVNKDAAESASAQVARKIIELLNTPFVIDDNSVQIGVSIGIALYPDDAIDEEALIKLADTAMYHAKEAGKNNFQFYTKDMHQRAEQLQVAETDLRNALLGDELVLAFQPKLKALDQSLYGFEALLRWQHPQKGLLMPSGFMRALDDLSLSSKIGEWVINEACKQLQHWRAQGHPDCSVSVNIFAHHYHDPDFVKSIDAALQKYQVPAHLLTIEITEALIMDDLGFAFGLLSDLKAIGVRIAVDDFATGTISIASLNRLPIDEIKIDRQFIRHIETDPQQLQLVKAIINIANTFGFDVVAEGVENQAQLQTLLSADCPKVQGYLFYRPMFNADLDACFEETSPKKA